MVNIARIGDILHSEASLARAKDSSGRERRKEAIKQTSNPIQKIVELGLHAIAGTFPKTVQGVLTLPYRLNGFEFIGSGAQATVLGVDNSVIKIIRPSFRMGKVEQEREAERLRGLIDVNRQVHKGIILPTSVEIGRHPIRNNSVVMLRQPWVQPDDDAPESASSQLLDFAQRSIDEMAPEGLLPDVGDPNNVAFIDGQLHLIDTIPVSRIESPEAFRAAENVLRAMALVSKKQAA